MVTPRVCFCSNITSCISALQDVFNYYVYIPKVKEDYTIDIYIPSFEDVKDACLTGEIWIKNTIDVECIGKIRPIFIRTDTYNINDQEINLLRFSWNWLEKYSDKYNLLY